MGGEIGVVTREGEGAEFWFTVEAPPADMVELHAGEVDVAVHSYKDLPTAPADGIAVAAVPRREDPADVLCARDGLTVETLPPGARVGTGSPRRDRYSTDRAG